MKGSIVTPTVTKVHSIDDNGKTFTDNLGRKYIYTTNGLIY